VEPAHPVHGGTVDLGSGVLGAGMSAKPLVVDNGTGFVKCGFAGDNFPAAIFPRYQDQRVRRACVRAPLTAGGGWAA
jgi:hypothetical protein